MRVCVCHCAAEPRPVSSRRDTVGWALPACGGAIQRGSLPGRWDDSSGRRRTAAAAGRYRSCPPDRATGCRRTRRACDSRQCPRCRRACPRETSLRIWKDGLRIGPAREHLAASPILGDEAENGEIGQGLARGLGHFLDHAAAPLGIDEGAVLFAPGGRRQEQIGPAGGLGAS